MFVPSWRSSILILLAMGLAACTSDDGEPDDLFAEGGDDPEASEVSSASSSSSSGSGSAGESGSDEPDEDDEASSTGPSEDDEGESSDHDVPTLDEGDPDCKVEVSASGDGLSVGDVPANFQTVDQHGDKVELYALCDKHVWIYSGVMWCPVCRPRQTGSYRDLAERHPDDLVVLYAMRQNLQGQPTTGGDLVDYDDYVDGIGDQVRVIPDPKADLWTLASGGESPDAVLPPEGWSGGDATEATMLLEPGVKVHGNGWVSPDAVDRLLD